MIIQNGGLPIGSRAFAAQLDRRRTRTNSLRCPTKMHKQSHPSIQKISVQVFYSSVRARTRAAWTRWWMGLDCLSRGFLLCLSPWWWACFNIRHLGHQYTAPCPNFRLYLSTGASYTFGVFLDPLEVEMGGGHSKVDLFCNNPSVFVDECLKDWRSLLKGVRGWKCYGCNIRLYWTISIKACIKVWSPLWGRQTYR